MPDKKRSVDYKTTAVEYFLANDTTQGEVCRIFHCSSRQLTLSRAAAARRSRIPSRVRGRPIIFCTKKREEAKKLLNPDAKATEVTSKLGQIWNELKKTVDKKMLQLFEQEASPVS